MYQGFMINNHGNCPVCKEEYNMFGGCKCNGYTHYVSDNKTPRKEKTIEQLKATGYVLYNIEAKEYLDESAYTTPDVNKALSCGEKKDIQTELETLDDPTNWVIKKLDILFTVTDLEEGVTNES